MKLGRSYNEGTLRRTYVPNCQMVRQSGEAQPGNPASPKRLVVRYIAPSDRTTGAAVTLISHMARFTVRSQLVLVALLSSASAVSTAQPIPPLPPPRPSEAPSPSVAPAAEVPTAAPEGGAPGQATLEPSTCPLQLRGSGFEVEATEDPKSANEGCRIDTPVRLKAVPVPSRPGAMVRLRDQPVVACRFARNFGQWLGELVAPVVVGTLNTELKSVQTGPGFECRNRNGAVKGKLSAHAEGLAIDITAFELANGSNLRIKPEGATPPNPALTALRTAACGWFTTVLGPGSDAAHADHLHLDVQQHGSSDRYRICQ